jgi:NTP pyrophosphatase (non-canonical NTP hydrolase)
MKPLLEIVKLNQTRYGTDFNGDTAVDKLKEELQELIDAIEINDITEIVDALSDIIVEVCAVYSLI